MPDLANLAALHAWLLLKARDHERLARRNADHAERELCEAEERRAQAAALAALLEPHGVAMPCPGQLSLFSDGGAA